MTSTRARETLPTLLDRLRNAYPDARYELDWKDPLQLLIAAILAAQSTDEQVNKITPDLFARYRDARAFAEADLSELEEAVRSTGYYRKKARTIRDVCRMLVDRFGGDVPRTMDELLELPGVARKTANVVLTNAHGIPSGIIVDLHVVRVAPRLGLTDQEKPERIEADLMNLVPRADWIWFGPALILHGRRICTASAPKCPECVLEDLCPKIGVTDTGSATEPNQPSTPRRRSVMAAPAPSRMSSSAASTGPEALPEDWRAVLAEEFHKPYFKTLQNFLAEERRQHDVFPPQEDVFNAFRFSPFDETNVLLLGQDPYHDDGQAHGLCFSVRPGIKPPPSLVNMFKELHNDLGCRIPNHGSLEGWARQGILMLNAVLTVRAHQANSHKDHGWETFTDAAIRALNARDRPVVFVLWGASAQKKEKLIDGSRHRILKAAHPSPLSAKKFFGSRPFSAINAALTELGHPTIDWQLPNL